MNNVNVPIKDPNEVLGTIKKILEKRRDIYINAPRLYPRRRIIGYL